MCNRGRDYVGDALALADPQVSPAYANLQGLPPMYLQIGEYDTVREGAIMLAANALRAGVAVTIEGWPGMVQGWHGLVTAGVPEAVLKRATAVLESLEKQHELPVSAAPTAPQNGNGKVVQPPEAPRRKPKLKPQVSGPSLFGDTDDVPF